MKLEFFKCDYCIKIVLIYFGRLVRDQLTSALFTLLSGNYSLFTKINTSYQKKNTNFLI